MVGFTWLQMSHVQWGLSNAGLILMGSLYIIWCLITGFLHCTYDKNREVKHVPDDGLLQVNYNIRRNQLQVAKQVIDEIFHFLPFLKLKNLWRQLQPWLTEHLISCFKLQRLLKNSVKHNSVWRNSVILRYRFFDYHKLSWNRMRSVSNF